MDEKKIYELHKKYSRGEYGDELLDIVWTHSLIVRDIAMQLGNKLIEKNIKIDLKLVEIGILIHDIGCYDCDCYKFIKKKVKPYVQHGIIGTKILKNEGFNEEIYRIASLHLGVGITKENIIQNNLSLEIKDFLPITLEEELVAYADNFHSKNGPKFMSFEEAKEKLNGLWPESIITLERFKKKFGEPELDKIINKYNKWQTKVEKWLRKLEQNNKHI